MPSFELIVIDFNIYRWISSDYNTLISDKISKSFRLVHSPPQITLLFAIVLPILALCQMMHSLLSTRNN